jgi:hypothetical protein
VLAGGGQFAEVIRESRVAHDGQYRRPAGGGRSDGGGKAEPERAPAQRVQQRPRFEPGQVSPAPVAGHAHVAGDDRLPGQRAFECLQEGRRFGRARIVGDRAPVPLAKTGDGRGDLRDPLRAIDAGLRERFLQA